LLLFLAIVSPNIFGEDTAGTGAVIGAFFILLGVVLLAFKRPRPAYKVCRRCGRQLQSEAAYCDCCGAIARWDEDRLEGVGELAEQRGVQPGRSDRRGPPPHR